MEALKLSGMKLVTDLSSEEELDVLRDFLLVDPLKITHQISFWKQELISITDEKEKAEIEEIIRTLKNHLKTQVRVTARVYSINSEETGTNTGYGNKKEDKPAVTETKETKLVKEKKEPKPATDDRSKNSLHVVKDEPVITADENRILRVKYEEYIKNINVEAIKLKVTEMLKNPATESEANEFATFILGEGLYQGKKVKKWNEEQIKKFVDSCKLGEVKDKKEGKKTITDTPVVQEEDLYVKYAHYLGDNKTSLAGIKAEVKFLMSEGKVEEAIEIAAFLLGAGEYMDSRPEKWSNLKIEEFITEIKNELKDKPLDLKPEGSSDIAPELQNNNNKDEIKDYDIKVDKFYLEVEGKILNDNLDEEAIKQWIYENIKSRKVETLEMFHNNESTQEELESMYATFFIGYVSNKFKEKELLSIDVNAEAIKLIKEAMESKAKTLNKVTQKVVQLYRQRGEKADLKETKEIVYNLAKENFPEYHAELLKNLGEKNIQSETIEHKEDPKSATEAPVIVQEQDVIPFPTKYPEIWDSVKEMKTLNDLHQKALELEKTQSFLIVTEMMNYVLKSGLLVDDSNQAVKWDTSAIELWINSMFTGPHQDVPEATPVIDTPATEVPEGIKNPSEEVVSPPAIDKTSQAAESTSPIVTESAENLSPSPQENVVISDSAVSAQETIADTSVIRYHPDVKIPDEDKEFKELYASNKDGFWTGFENLVKKYTAEGKDKKEITHLLTDKIKAIGGLKENSQCFARNYRKSSITEIYKTLNKKGSDLGIPGWKIE